ncbi:MAG: hypothetical protein HN404_12770 [Gemmatimonadetes bacterium]|jgi:hypothetical protein|nr:hypothetical protein [Gemmatimonadota bacterium]
MTKSPQVLPDAADLPTPAQIRSAIFIDIKGPSDDLPVLASFFAAEDAEGVPVQVVTDVAFADAALAKDLRVQGFEDLIEDLVERCQQDERSLITWGTALADATDRHTQGPALGRQLATLILDVRPALLATGTATGSKARKRREPDLVDLLRRAELPIPRNLGSKQSTQRLRYVRQQLARHDAYESITSTAKAKWTKLLQQGQNDCRGVYQLLTAIVAKPTQE